MTFSWSPPVCTSVPADERGGGQGECSDGASFDIPAGRLSIQSSAGLTNCYCDLNVDEDFQIQGLPIGTHVRLVARLDAKLTTHEGCCGGSSCWARMASGTEVRWQPGQMDTTAMVERDSSLFLPVGVIVGTPFRVSFELTASSAEALAFAEASFSFGGLPEKATIVSCRGYVQAAVPTQTTSWGRLKARYR